MILSSGEARETLTLFCPLERANRMPVPEQWKQFQIPNALFSISPEFRTMDKVQNPKVLEKILLITVFSSVRYIYSLEF
jgi:hypothetical protein